MPTPVVGPNEVTQAVPSPVATPSPEAETAMLPKISDATDRSERSDRSERPSARDAAGAADETTVLPPVRDVREARDEHPADRVPRGIFRDERRPTPQRRGRTSAPGSCRRSAIRTPPRTLPRSGGRAVGVLVRTGPRRPRWTICRRWRTSCSAITTVTTRTPAPPDAAAARAAERSRLTGPGRIPGRRSRVPGTDRIAGIVRPFPHNGKPEPYTTTGRAVTHDRMGRPGRPGPSAGAARRRRPGRRCAGHRQSRRGSGCRRGRG